MLNVVMLSAIMHSVAAPNGNITPNVIFKNLNNKNIFV
jgi:hypothetical protein